MEKFDWASGLLNIRERVQKELASRGEKPFLIVIAGSTCSGKTFLAKELADMLAPIATPVISIDDYYKDIRDRTLPRDENNRPLFNQPEAYRSEELLQAIYDLRRGRTVRTPEYDMSTNTWLGSRGTIINSSQIVIVEGLFAIEFLGGFNGQLKIFLDIDFDLALERCIVRDTAKYQIDKAKISKVFTDRVWPEQLKFVMSQKKYADIIIYQ